MKRIIHVLAMALLGGVLVLGLGGCPPGDDSSDTGVVSNDGGGQKDAQVSGCEPPCEGSTPDCVEGICVCNNDSCSGQTPHCVDGACVCDSTSCGTGFECDLIAGTCRPVCVPGCTGTTPDCVGGVCQCNADSCGAGTTPDCVNGTCQCNATSCGAAATCIAGACVPCANVVCGGVCCEPGQTCENDECHTKDVCNDLCKLLPETPSCNAATALCECTSAPADSCTAPTGCIDGVCCAVPCGTACCGAGQTCGAGPACEGACAAGHECGATGCCADDYVCENDTCVYRPCNPVCEGTTPVCNTQTKTCECNPTSCGAGFFCDNGTCVAEPGPDAGMPDGGPTPPTDGGYPAIETTIPVIQNPLDPGHAAFSTPGGNNRVHFKGVAVSPIFQFKKYAESDKPPSSWYCLKGIYLADATAPAEHNGVLVLSESTVPVMQNQYDGGVEIYGGSCNKDSVLEVVDAASKINIGDELDVTGFFAVPGKDWDACFVDETSGQCTMKDQNGNLIYKGIVKASRPGSITKTGISLGGLPPGLPAQVSIDEIAATGISGTYPNYVVQLGPKWWDYHNVLVTVPDVVVTNDSGKSCNWTVQHTSQAGADGGTSLIVQDDIYFTGTSCNGRPTVGTTFTAITGPLTWWAFSNASDAAQSTAETQIAPRNLNTDLGLPAPGPDAGQ